MAISADFTWPGRRRCYIPPVGGGGGQRSRGTLIVAVVGAVVVLIATASIVYFNRAAPESAPTGMVFVDGQYLPPPYQIRTTAAGIEVNGRVVRVAAGAVKPSVAPAPATPRSALEVTDVLASRLAQGNVADAAFRARLVELARSFPGVVSVVDEGSSITVTDASGLASSLALLVEPAPPQALEQESAELAALAADWSERAASGALLFLSAGTTVEVRQERAGEVMRAVFDAFDAAPSERLDRLTRAIGAPPLASALLAAGPPPATLRSRASSLIPEAGAAPSVPAPGGAHLAAPLGDATSHKDSATPKSRKAYLFSSLKYGYDWEPISKAAWRHGYDVVRYQSSGCSPGDATIANFLAIKKAGGAGIFYAYAHGTTGQLGLEQYCDEADAEKSYRALLKQGLNVRLLEVPGGFLGLGTNYAVAILARSITANWEDKDSIVHLNSCEGISLAAAFNAREFIGANDSVCAYQPWLYNRAFWQRVDGTKEDGTKRNVGDAFAAAYAGTIFRLRSRADGHTVLSPAVASYEPHAAAYTIGQRVDVTIRFDTPMATDVPAEKAAFIIGRCRPQAIAAAWKDERTLVVSFVPAESGTAEMRIRAEFALSGRNRVRLDGNRDPIGTDHVGPNGDDYELPDVPCVATGATATPTPSAVSVTPEPKGTCSGPVKLIADQFYPDAVQGGNGTPPTFSTAGKKYCLTHLATYHWNDGKGAPEGGTLSLVDAGGRVIGTWKAIATPGTGGALVNWEADIPTIPPVILDGNYTVRDSAPATLSWSKASGGKGFVRVWAIEYVVQ